jgi:hypothetical protein
VDEPNDDGTDDDEDDEFEISDIEGDDDNENDVDSDEFNSKYVEEMDDADDIDDRSLLPLAWPPLLLSLCCDKIELELSLFVLLSSLFVVSFLK